MAAPSLLNRLFILFHHTRFYGGYEKLRAPDEDMNSRIKLSEHCFDDHCCLLLIASSTQISFHELFQIMRPAHYTNSNTHDTTYVYKESFALGNLGGGYDTYPRL